MFGFGAYLGMAEVAGGRAAKVGGWVGEELCGARCTTLVG